MHRFGVGDWVEVIGVLAVPEMKQGTILRVLSHFERPERLNEYEVRFGLKTALHYEHTLERSRPRSTRTECFHIKFSFACFENYATEPSGARSSSSLPRAFRTEAHRSGSVTLTMRFSSDAVDGAATGGLIIMVIKPEDRQLLADFVKNLTKEQRSEILYKLLKTLSTTNSILNEDRLQR
jgi:hypothetical protein